MASGPTIIAISVGNTRIQVGQFVQGELKQVQRLPNNKLADVIPVIAGWWQEIDEYPGAAVLLASVNDAVADRLDSVGRLVYRSNILGADGRITNTGGGNTSSKIIEPDPLTGADTEVLWVKGSGGDLRTSTRANFSSLCRTIWCVEWQSVHPGACSTLAWRSLPCWLCAHSAFTFAWHEAHIAGELARETRLSGSDFARMSCVP